MKRVISCWMRVGFVCEYHHPFCVPVGDVSSHKGDVGCLEECFTHAVYASLDLLRFPSEYRTIKTYVTRCLYEAHIGWHLVPDRQRDHIAGNELRRSHSNGLAFSDNDTFRREEIENGVHDAARGPVLESGETGLGQDDDENEDGKGKVGGRRRIAERPPANEEDDDGDPKDGTKPAEHVAQEFPDILWFSLSYGILAITLKVASCDCFIETLLCVDAKHLADLLDIDSVEGELLEEIGDVVLALSLVLGFDDLDREGSEANG